jgi:hypothetical protein
MTRKDDSTGSQNAGPTTQSSDMLNQDFGDLRRVRDSVPGRLWVVALIAFWERAAFWGLLAPWRSYIPGLLQHSEILTRDRKLHGESAPL